MEHNAERHASGREREVQTQATVLILIDFKTMRAKNLTNPLPANQLGFDLASECR
jgi:hypothetical protein